MTDEGCGPQAAHHPSACFRPGGTPAREPAPGRTALPRLAAAQSRTLRAAHPATPARHHAQHSPCRCAPSPSPPAPAGPAPPPWRRCLRQGVAAPRKARRMHRWDALQQARGCQLCTARPPALRPPAPAGPAAAPCTLSASGCAALSTAASRCFRVPSLYWASTSCGGMQRVAQDVRAEDGSRAAASRGGSPACEAGSAPACCDLVASCKPPHLPGLGLHLHHGPKTLITPRIDQPAQGNINLPS